MYDFGGGTIIVNNSKSISDNEIDSSERMVRAWFARVPREEQSSECRDFVERLDSLSAQQRQEVFDEASNVLALNILGSMP